MSRPIFNPFRLFVLVLIITAGFWVAPAGAYGSCKGTVGGKVGNCAPDFVLKNLDGNPVKLSSYQGRVVFLNFWATWCAPCVVEMPALEKANAVLRSDEFVMLTISIDKQGRKDIDPFIQRVFKGTPPKFPILLDPEGKISGRYGTFKVPETYIIDKTGEIRDKVEGIREWNDSLILHYIELLTKQ